MIRQQPYSASKKFTPHAGSGTGQPRGCVAPLPAGWLSERAGSPAQREATIESFLDALGDRGIREANGRQNMKEIGPNRAAARNASHQRDEALKRARKTQLKAERMECDRRNGFSLDGDLPTAADVAAAWREHDEAIKDVSHWSERERINWDAVERGAA